MASGAVDEQRLVMLAKPPVPGRVKTRLTGPGALTPAQAAALHAACVADLTGRLAAGRAWRMTLCHPAGWPWPPTAWPAALAVEDEPAVAEPRDLGGILAAVVAGQLRRGARRVVVIGADCPHLPAAWVEQAFAALGDHELVLGPDAGGGCYLIGARRPLDLVAGEPIVWSAGTDYDELVRRGGAQDWSVAHLPVTYDLDRLEDVEQLAAELAAERVAARTLPITAALVGGWVREGTIRCNWR